MSRFGGFNGPSSNQVFLNVYDLHDNNAILYPWGLGMYHSGVQIGREEYTFAAQSGIFTHDAKGAPNAVFRESINMGVFKGTSKDLETIISSLRPNFGGGDYHVLNKNCNAFANEFVIRLVGKEIPGYVNRMAYFGSYFSCLLPPSVANDAPVDNASSGNPGYSVSGGRGYSRVSSGEPSQKQAKQQSISSESNFNIPGKKLGGTGTSDSSDNNPMGVQERRLRLLAAAGNRSSSSS